MISNVIWILGKEIPDFTKTSTRETGVFLSMLTTQTMGHPQPWEIVAVRFQDWQFQILGFFRYGNLPKMFLLQSLLNRDQLLGLRLG